MLRFSPLLLVFLAGCYSPIKKSVQEEYDPIVMAQASHDMAIFWIVAAICSAIFLSIWVIFYYRAQR